LREKKARTPFPGIKKKKKYFTGVNQYPVREGRRKARKTCQQAIFLNSKICGK